MQKEINKFSIFFENVKIISFEKYDKSFTFIVDGKYYETSRFYADFISLVVNEYHCLDETINEQNYYHSNNDNHDIIIKY